mmetsp:Transcript_64048/g.99819  ORF Transcript_64048/g.99819 Transcript_64048/m.99819 type:complete len:153 (-) Transcript_64048:48-506(-)
MDSFSTHGLVPVHQAVLQHTHHEARSPERRGVVPELDFSVLKKPAQVLNRPDFVIELERVGPHWRHFGFTVGLDEEGIFLTVDSLWSPSLISEWNKSRTPRRQLKAGDLIKSANGTSGNNVEMLKEIQSIGAGKRLTLEVEGGRFQNPQEAI